MQTNKIRLVNSTENKEITVHNRQTRKIGRVMYGRNLLFLKSTASIASFNS